jgi:hypothetical protein
MHVDIIGKVCKNTTLTSYFCKYIMPRMTLEERIELSLQRSVVMAKGLLVKAGYGVYVKAKLSSLTGNPVPVVPLIEIGLAALTKLGAQPELGSAAKDYMDGKTTQMPMAVVLNVGNSRVSRRIGFGAKSIRYEA